MNRPRVSVVAEIDGVMAEVRDLREGADATQAALGYDQWDIGHRIRYDDLHERLNRLLHLLTTPDAVNYGLAAESGRRRWHRSAADRTRD